MANAKDVAVVIQSALDEIGVTGKLDVSMDGDQQSKQVGTLSGDDVQIAVKVEDLDVDR